MREELLAPQATEEDVADEVGPGHLRLGEDLVEQCRRVGRGGGDADAQRSPVADVAGQRAGVDAADADDPLAVEFRVEAATRAPVRGARGWIPDDVARDPDAG